MMNYIINIKTRDLVVGGVMLVFVASKVEKKIEKFMKNAKKERDILKKAVEDSEEESKDYIYCPCCGKKIKED